MNLTPITKHYGVPEEKRDTLLESISFFLHKDLKHYLWEQNYIKS